MENEVFNVTPNTYPKILESISFKREILKTSLTDSLTIKEYLLLNKKSFDLTSILSFPAELFSELRSFLFSSFTENKLTNRINEKNNFLHVSEVEEELFLELDDNWNTDTLEDLWNNYSIESNGIHIQAGLQGSILMLNLFANAKYTFIFNQEESSIKSFPGLSIGIAYGI